MNEPEKKRIFDNGVYAGFHMVEEAMDVVKLKSESIKIDDLMFVLDTLRGLYGQVSEDDIKKNIKAVKGICTGNI